MKQKYPALFKRGKIGNVELKNRIYKPAAEDSCSGDGYVPDYLCRFYAEEARGGAGLIIGGMYVVTPREKCGLDRRPILIRNIPLMRSMSWWAFMGTRL